MNIFIIHGAYGNPEENWFPWLKIELEKLGHKVVVPKFPTPEGQSLTNWLNIFKQYEQYLPNSILIGHSLGPAFILNLLETNPVKASFFVSGFIDSLGNPEFDNINRSFIKDFNWIKIKQNCPKFFVFHSDNDPYVPLEKAEELANRLQTKITLVKGAGHFNKDSSYLKFELLLDMIKTFSKN